MQRKGKVFDMFAIFRKNVFGTEDVSAKCNSLDYYTSKSIAEDIAEDLNISWNTNDAIGHPWYGSKFFVQDVSKEYIKNNSLNAALQRACLEMAM